MNGDQGIPSDFLEPLRRARDKLTLGDEVGLALRAHRRELGLSQRAYATQRRLGRSMLARLEAGAGRLALDTVVDALEGTGFALVVTACSPGDPPDGSDAGAAAVATTQLSVVGAVVRGGAQRHEWEPTDLVARVRGGGRRFPAHRVVQAVDSPPLWWWMHEFFTGPTEKPRWYSPVPWAPLVEDPVDASSDALPAPERDQVDDVEGDESGAA